MNKFTGITSGGATIPIWDKTAHEEISGKQDALSTAQLNAISSVSGKQDKLTAGEHISIVDNVISVSGELGKVYSGTGYVNVDNANDTIGLNADATSAISSINGSYDLSAGDNITFTTSGNTIYINGQQGGSSEYSAGSNINITDNVISGKDWTDDISVATEGKADLSAIHDLSAGDNITIVQSGDGYVINSTGGGSEIPSALSGRWEDTSDTVETMSGAWGGSALPVSAGPGIKMELIDDKLVFSNDETVLWENSNGSSESSGFTVSELLTNFERIRYIGSTNTCNFTVEIPTYSEIISNLRFSVICMCSATDSAPVQLYGKSFTSNNGLTYNASRSMVRWFAYNTTSVNGTQPYWGTVYKIIGINRIAGGN